MQPVRLPPMAVIKFHGTNKPTKIPKQQDGERACRSAKEDVVIQFRRGPRSYMESKFTVTATD